MKDRNGFEQKETRSKTVEMAAKSWRLRPSVAGMWLCGAGGGKVGVGLAMQFHKGGGQAPSAPHRLCQFGSGWCHV